MDWKTIVVGYDRTHASNKALAAAADIAESAGAKLVVTSVARVLPSGAAAHGLGPFDPADSPELHQEDLGHARELLSTRKKLAVEYDLEIGDPADAIVALAERRGADLIVVGGHHEQGFLGRLLHGDVGSGVSRKAPCDVLIVH
jgi:nucleotide-binding universal stress UspA family protein